MACMYCQLTACVMEKSKTNDLRSLAFNNYKHIVRYHMVLQEVSDLVVYCLLIFIFIYIYLFDFQSVHHIRMSLHCIRNNYQQEKLIPLHYSTYTISRSALSNKIHSIFSTITQGWPTMFMKVLTWFNIAQCIFIYCCKFTHKKNIPKFMTDRVYGNFRKDAHKIQAAINKLASNKPCFSVNFEA